MWRVFTSELSTNKLLAQQEKIKKKEVISNLMLKKLNKLKKG
jgi:hypothetical protein